MPDLAVEAAWLVDIADWIDQAVGVGHDQAEQLRAIAATVEHRAVARKRDTRAYEEAMQAFRKLLRKQQQLGKRLEHQMRLLKRLRDV